MTVSIRQGRTQLAAVRREQEAWAREQGWDEGKMDDLLSSSALAFNFFGLFEQDVARRSALTRAMDLDGEIQDVQFERKCPTGVGGTPPQLDVVLDLGVRVVGLESRFTEWLAPRPSKIGVFDVKYLQRRQKLWESAGLPRSQAVAEAIGTGELQFLHLDALQLLKLGLGLRACFGEKASLAYVYLERAGDVGMAHVRELDTFTSAISPELTFRSWTYQEVYAGLRREQLDAPLAAHLKEFAERYLGA